MLHTYMLALRIDNRVDADMFSAIGRDVLNHFLIVYSYEDDVLEFEVRSADFTTELGSR